MPASAAAIRPSLYGSSQVSSATMPAHTAEATCGRVVIIGTAMPMKVAIIAKSSPQLATSGTAWPNSTPTRVDSCQLMNIVSAAPRKNQCLCGEASSRA